MLSLPLGSVWAQPEAQSKKSASEGLRELFEEGDAVESRRGSMALVLERRTLDPDQGLAPELKSRSISEREPALAIASWGDFPTAAEWAEWRSLGIRYLEYLENRHWLVELTTDAEKVFSTSRATTLVEFLPSDKVALELDRPDLHPGLFDPERGLVVVDVTVAPETAAATLRELHQTFHIPVQEYQDNSGVRLSTLVVEPAAIDDLAERHWVLAIEPGSWRQEVLMDGIRPAVNGDVVTGSDGVQLTGARIRAATKERLYSGSVHEAFWNHDGAGQLTVPRWTEVAAEACVEQFSSTAWHGMMSAGILLGNGWFSGRYTDDPLGFRGIAPEAILECYHETGARAHLSSHSYVGNDAQWDRSIVGEESEERFHAHTVAGGNSGDDQGYYSLRNDSKNAMVVANAQVDGPINWTSSAGPSNDGRLKPDITAPTSNPQAEDVGFSLEVARIEVRRGATKVASWVFNSNGPAWHLGWGEPQHPFGKVFLDIARSAGGKMRIDTQPRPWGDAWINSPLLGTQTLPSSSPGNPGAPLAIQGQAEDVLVIEYRALPTTLEGYGYFDLSPIWFRSFPEQLGCDGLCFWHGQAGFGAIGIGDGTWRSLELPVGLATSVIWGENPDWDDEQTWAGESIQWLGLRVKKTDIQPTPSYAQYYNQASGGTSGASPVVGGAYALAMEHLTRLYKGVDLDRKQEPSVYFPASVAEVVYGMPYNSTWKAIFLQTAKDMIRLHAHPSVPPNPDTGIPNVYHAGPDYTTGYGLLDIQAGIDLMTEVADGREAHEIHEYVLHAGDFHTYEFSLTDFQSVSGSLLATLVWDDEPNTGSTLVNNLGLILVDPSGEIHYPWSLEVPELPVTAADIVPARRDQPNDRDNVEQVCIDDLSPAQAGVWTAYVVDNGMAGLTQSQKYSLVISPVDVD